MLFSSPAPCPRAIHLTTVFIKEKKTKNSTEINQKYLHIVVNRENLSRFYSHRGAITHNLLYKKIKPFCLQSTLITTDYENDKSKFALVFLRRYPPYHNHQLRRLNFLNFKVFLLYWTSRSMSSGLASLFEKSLKSEANCIGSSKGPPGLVAIILR